MHARPHHIYLRTKFSRVPRKNERTMRGANLRKHARTAAKLRKETSPIKHNPMGNANRSAIMGVLHTRKPDHTM